MNKRLIAFLSILSLSLSVLLIPANAIENGESALNHPRIVSMYFTIDSSPNEIWPSCSAWLYSPRIVFTAAHCVYDGSVRPKKLLRTPSNTYVGLVKLAEKFVADNPYVEPKVTNSSSNKKTTITCIKGKTTKKVTAANPKCPGGYKKI